MNETLVRIFPTISLDNGTSRQVLADSPELMVVQFDFPEGKEGAPHNHHHVQSTYVKSGVFEFTVGERTMIVRAGDSFVIPSNVIHGCRAIEPGTLIDTFTPRRDDFL
ncbi:cupin domain-containing protein [Rhizobium halophytocola]|uniref:Quercetin dioxygenase-like cupin family protein n=1 Tax=Rhizobium halophytocola TaxID=735519 RepID=A0ABS4DTR3_9HYPH|nr:cupin domain-containing protein [Rhizobium halophytocola]MBP1849065.1 quercetin dioxygenase-like cupin family protein [Rhizobium halophytocola]